MIAMAVVLAIAAAAVGGVRGSRRMEGAGLPAAGATPGGALHLVRRGDTLWGIARSLQGDDGGDLRRLIHAIRKANGLSGSLIRPGQVLSLPAVLGSRVRVPAAADAAETVQADGSLLLGIGDVRIDLGGRDAGVP